MNPAGNPHPSVGCRATPPARVRVSNQAHAQQRNASEARLATGRSGTGAFKAIKTLPADASVPLRIK